MAPHASTEAPSHATAPSGQAQMTRVWLTSGQRKARKTRRRSPQIPDWVNSLRLLVGIAGWVKSNNCGLEAQASTRIEAAKAATEMASWCAAMQKYQHSDDR